MWPPGSADTVCPRRPLMTHVHHWAKTAQTDHVTLRPWPLTLEVMTPVADAWCGSSSSIRIASLKFLGLAVRKIWRTMCVSINGRGDLDLWPFDLETGMRVASNVGNCHSEFWHDRPFGSRVIRYVRDGRTDGQTDRQKQRLLPPSLRAGAQQHECSIDQRTCTSSVPSCW